MPVYIPTPVLQPPGPFSATPIPRDTPTRYRTPPASRPGAPCGTSPRRRTLKAAGARPPPMQHRIDTETNKSIVPQRLRLNCSLSRAGIAPQKPRIGPAKANCQPRARRVESQITRVFCPPQASLLPVLAGYHLRRENKKTPESTKQPVDWSWALAFHALASLDIQDDLAGPAVDRQPEGLRAVRDPQKAVIPAARAGNPSILYDKGTTLFSALQ